MYGIFSNILEFLTVVSPVLGIMFFISLAVIFYKTGAFWLSAFIPIYNVFVFAKILKLSKFQGIALFIYITVIQMVFGVMSFLFVYIVFSLFLSLFGIITSPVLISLFTIIIYLSPIFIIGLFILPIVIVIVHKKLAYAFDKGTLFALGLTFVPFLFYPLLAFGKSKYIRENYFLKQETDTNSQSINNQVIFNPKLFRLSTIYNIYKFEEQFLIANTNDNNTNKIGYYKIIKVNNNYQINKILNYNVDIKKYKKVDKENEMEVIKILMELMNTKSE